MHQTPGGYEIEHCRWRLDQELALIRPRLTVALGATAAGSLLGRRLSVMRERVAASPGSGTPPPA